MKGSMHRSDERARCGKATTTRRRLRIPFLLFTCQNSGARPLLRSRTTRFGMKRPAAGDTPVCPGSITPRAVLGSGYICARSRSVKSFS
jgi:hypothetical protein